MKTKLQLKSLLLSILFVSFSFYIEAQVGIGNTSPNSDALLDVGTNTSTKGIRIPRVSLTTTASFSPLSAHVSGMLVYNTVSAGSGSTAVSPGFYYNDGSAWIKVSKKDDWKLNGNSGTIAGTNFIGTTDAIPVSFRINNTEQFRMTTTGELNLFSNGTATTPVINWNGDTDTGIFHSAANELSFSTGGTNRLQILSDGSIRANASGTAANPLFAWTGDTNKGFYSPGADQFGLVTNGVERVRIPNSNQIFAMADGTNALPFYSWNNDSDTGLYRIDANTLGVSTNATERIRVLSDGRVSVNNNNPFGGDRFTVSGELDEYAINGLASGTGVGVYGESTGTGGGVEGINIGTGNGVFGFGANSHGVFGYTTYTGGPFLTGGVLGWGGGANQANGVLAVANQISTLSSNIGIRAVSGSTTSISSGLVLNVGVNTNATDLGLYVMTEKTSGIREAAQFQTNYAGIPTDADARDMRAQLAGFTNASQQGGSNMYYGGYFYSGRVNNASWAYAGSRYGNTNYKIIGNGAVSTIVSGANDGDSKKIMFASEAPEVLFEDYGSGQLSNGTATITIDPIFSKNITVNQKHPLRVFIQLEGDCNGVYVTNKSGTSFTVNELQSGTSNISFSWHIVANRKDEGGRSSEEISEYSELRFPDAPSKIQTNGTTSQDLNEISYKKRENKK